MPRRTRLEDPIVFDHAIRARLRTTQAVLEELPRLVLSKRTQDGLGHRQAAEQIGISSSVLHRIEHGQPVRSSNVLRVVAWLATLPGRPGSDPPPGRPVRARTRAATG